MMHEQQEAVVRISPNIRQMAYLRSIGIEPDPLADVKCSTGDCRGIRPVRGTSGAACSRRMLGIIVAASLALPILFVLALICIR